MLSFPRHRSATFRTLLLDAGCPRRMRYSVPALGTDARASRPGCEPAHSSPPPTAPAPSRTLGSTDSATAHHGVSCCNTAFRNLVDELRRPYIALCHMWIDCPIIALGRLEGAVEPMLSGCRNLRWRRCRSVCFCRPRRDHHIFWCKVGASRLLRSHCNTLHCAESVAEVGAFFVYSAS
jgi:hypothetical protein